MWTYPGFAFHANDFIVAYCVAFDVSPENDGSSELE